MKMSKAMTDDRSALVVRWLCHDMATPVATLLTASELMGDSGDPEINDLITAAIRRLSARLKLVRLALGSASTMSPQALEKIFQDSLTDTPLVLSLSDEPEAPPSSVIAAAGLLLAELQRNAPLTIDADGARWTPGLPMAEMATLALSGKPDERPRSAMIALIADQSRASGWELQPKADGVAFKRL
jgi:hypothetical protein